jgi:MFS transporter, DHA2 family, multidrug resistance protein
MEARPRALLPADKPDDQVGRFDLVGFLLISTFLGALEVVLDTGGSIGISLANNVLWDREQFHQVRLAENTVPSSVQYQDTLHQATQYFLAQGSLPPAAQGQAVGWIGQEIVLQASYLAYSDVSWTLTPLALGAVPLALTLRKVKLGGAAPATH